MLVPSFLTIVLSLQWLNQSHNACVNFANRNATKVRLLLLMHFIKVSFSTVFHVGADGFAVKRCFISLPCEWALVAALGRTSVLHLLLDPRMSTRQAVYICLFRRLQDILQIHGNVISMLMFFLFSAHANIQIYSGLPGSRDECRLNCGLFL